MSRASGSLSRRRLPEHDASIDALDPEVREKLASIWAQRAQSELGAGSGFAQLVTELYALGAEATVLELATSAAADEVRHAQLCAHLASAYAGAEVALPRAKLVAMPRHRGVSEAERFHLHVVGLCCINETIAAGFLAASLQATDSPLVRTVQREHIADEINHARVGWAHFASDRVDGSLRAALRPHVARLVSVNRRLWHERIATLPEDGVPGHGYPSRVRLVCAVDESIRDVVLPGLRHVGLA